MSGRLPQQYVRLRVAVSMPGAERQEVDNSRPSVYTCSKCDLHLPTSKWGHMGSRIDVSLVRPAGFEGPPGYPGKNRFFESGSTGGGDIDSQLRTLISVWPTLSQSTRAKILADIRTT